MQIILLEDIRNLGKIGEVVNVKDGYGRNFLIKFGKALRADKKNIEYVNKKRNEINKKNSEQKKLAKDIYEKIKKKTIRFNKETKENGDLYGNIKPKEISKYFLDLWVDAPQYLSVGTLIFPMLSYSFLVFIVFHLEL